MASLQLFKTILVIKWVLCTLHMVQLPPITLQPNILIHNLQFIGIGALTSPLSATQFAQVPYWSSHYLVSLSLSVSNVVILAKVFKFQAQDGTSMGQFSFPNPNAKRIQEFDTNMLIS